MATKYIERKNGKGAYLISVYRGNGKPYYYETWNIPEGWSKTAIARGLKKAEREAIEKVKSGEAMTRSDRKEQERLAAEALSKLFTLKRYVETVYMPAKTVTVSEHTRTSLLGIFNTHILPVLGEEKLSEIKPAQISSLLLNMQKNSKRHSTVVKVYNTLNNVFKMAYLDDTITVNPMGKVARPKATKAEKTTREIDAFSVDEINYIRECAENEPLKWRTLLNLLIDTGCRRGEALGLKWDKVYHKSQEVRFENNLCYTPERGVYEDTIKNGKARTNIVTSHTMQLLQALHEEQLSDGVVSPYVFTQDARGGAMHPDSPSRYIPKFCRKYGLWECRPHKFRHTFISIAITNGADIASVAAIVGDNIDTILRTYTHADEDSKAPAANVYQMALENGRK